MVSCLDMRILRWCGLVAATLLSSNGVQAAYPDRPIRLIVPWAAGGSTDALARVVGQRMSATLGQEVLVENRAGAGGSLGVAAAAKAAPDGYTLTIIELPHAIAPSVALKLPYDVLKDFAPISLIGTSALMLFASSENPRHQNLSALLAQARAAPGALALAHSGNGASSHLAGELLQVRAGVRLNMVPYRGSSPALTDVAGGLVAAHFATLASASALVSAGKVRPIAVASLRRMPVMPDVPTLLESGVPDMILEQWWGLVAPAGTPTAVIERLRAELHAALGHPNVRERLRLLAVEKQPTSPLEFGRFVADEVRRWGKVARDAGLKPE
jgi:tripartite-type tricarboxylate transporter receptor subunit TctC